MLAIAVVALLAQLATLGQTSMCPDTEGMSDEIRKMFVEKHNEYRTQVAKGEAKNKLGGNAPKAARMLKMTYDCAIEENMMNYAKECKFAHNSYKDRNYWGQSLYMTSARNINKTRAAENSVSAWFSQL
uniref:SCP domain-containing protein n=1 Tax=Haemonchus contortus TaxID=6289 RepID=A0A7I4YTJ8_HAECO